MTHSITPDQKIMDVVERYPQTAQVFAQYGLDMCCGGIHPIVVAAQAHGVDIACLISEINAVIREATNHQLDVRGLEPPEPMVRILSRLSEMGPEDVLEVTHFREPFPLYPILEEKGFDHAIKKVKEDFYILNITKKK